MSDDSNNYFGQTHSWTTTTYPSTSDVIDTTVTYNRTKVAGIIGSFTFKQPERNMSIHIDPKTGIPSMEFKENGDIYIKGKLIENDQELVDTMRDFLFNNKAWRTKREVKEWIEELDESGD